MACMEGSKPVKGQPASGGACEQQCPGGNGSDRSPRVDGTRAPMAMTSTGGQASRAWGIFHLPEFSRHSRRRMERLGDRPLHCDHEGETWGSFPVDMGTNPSKLGQAAPHRQQGRRRGGQGPPIACHCVSEWHQWEGCGQMCGPSDGRYRDHARQRALRTLMAPHHQAYKHLHIWLRRCQDCQPHNEQIRVHMAHTQRNSSM